ncbi:MAG: hypothetical protein QOI68_1044 [Pseudonocardiales bacterium]|nr:hypothetical protein [Pseudonocardiales bacterium]MDT7622322.1 hypothetical protein [Pseudonocardiales bacterium]MDT7675023.1 hypothetical protein [Pseudonocardiales bacterium]
MLRGMRVGSLAAAVAAASAVVLLPLHVPMAFAADGTFTYTGGDGKVKTSANPPSGDCLKVVGSGPVKNNTDASVTLYKTPDCTDANRITTIDDNSTQNRVPTFQSLLWDDNND